MLATRLWEPAQLSLVKLELKTECPNELGKEWQRILTMHKERGSSENIGC